MCERFCALPSIWTSSGSVRTSAPASSATRTAAPAAGVRAATATGAPVSASLALSVGLTNAVIKIQFN